MCMISEVTIDSSAVVAAAPAELSMSKVVSCVVAHHPLDESEPVPAVVPMMEDEDGSESEGYSSMSDDELDDDDESDSEEPVVKSSPQQEEFHELYLPVAATATSYIQPITFSGGMDAEECAEYYRTLEEAAEVAAQREAEEEVHSRKRGLPIFRRMRRESESSCKKIKSDDDDSSSVSSSSFASARSSARSSVSFSEDVKVQPVFTIDHFDDEIWDNTWTPRQIVKAGKRRAKVEFRYDGCDWRSATEEEGMFRDPRTGLLEHPVHYYDTDSRREVVQTCLIVPGRR